jgi:hypothetical protein
MKRAIVFLIILIVAALLVPIASAGAGGGKVIRGQGCVVIDAQYQSYWDSNCEVRMVPNRHGYTATATGTLPRGAALPKSARAVPVTALGFAGCWAVDDGCHSVLTPSGRMKYVAQVRTN